MPGTGLAVSKEKGRKHCLGVAYQLVERMHGAHVLKDMRKVLRQKKVHRVQGRLNPVGSKERLPGGENKPGLPSKKRGKLIPRGGHRVRRYQMVPCSWEKAN